jgi:hypothetical protein
MNKTTLGALAAFGALLAVVMVTRETKQVNEGVPKLTLAPLQGEVVGIELTGPTPASLKYENNVWTVGGKPADEAQVKQLTDALKDFHATDFVTEKTEKHAEYEVDDAKGVKMTLTATTGPGWSLVFGKAAKQGGTYVRDAKSNAIFITRSPLAFQAKKGASGWRRKNIATAAAGDIVKVHVKQESGELGLVKEGEAWKLDGAPPAGFRFDEGAARRLVQQLGALNAQDFSDDAVTPIATVDFETKDGKKLSLKLGAKTQANMVPLALEGDPQTYLLPAWSGDQLLKKLEDMRDTTLLSFDATKVNKLSISAGGKSTVLARNGADWKVVEPKTLPTGFEFDPNTVQSQLMRLRGIRGVKAVTDVPEAKTGLSKPVASVELSLEGGGKQQLKFGAEAPDKALYVKGSADNLLYAIGAHEKASFDQGLDMFKKRPPPDMSQIRGLDQLPPDVRKQLEAQLRQQQH